MPHHRYTALGPRRRRQLQEVLQDLFATRTEVAELRALLEDFNRFAEEAVPRFEITGDRFTDLRQNMDRHFEAVIGELRTERLHLFSPEKRGQG